MGMGFAPTWLRQVTPLLHMTILTTGYQLSLVKFFCVYHLIVNKVYQNHGEISFWKTEKENRKKFKDAVHGQESSTNDRRLNSLHCCGDCVYNWRVLGSAHLSDNDDATPNRIIRIDNPDSDLGSELLSISLPEVIPCLPVPVHRQNFIEIHRAALRTPHAQKTQLGRCRRWRR